MLLVVSSFPPVSALLAIAASWHACHSALALHRPLVMAVGRGHDQSRAEAEEETREKKAAEKRLATQEK